MGDIADYYMDLALQQDAEFEANQHFRREAIQQMEKDYSFGVLKWRTQNSGHILVSKMTREHIENCIAMIKRTMANEEISEKWIELLGYELEKR